MISSVGAPPDIRGSLGLFSCLSRSVLAWTPQIPDSLYSADNGVAFREPVMVRQPLLSSTSILEALADLSHNAAQYSTVE